MYVKLFLAVILVILSCGNSYADISFADNNKTDHNHIFTTDYSISILTGSSGDKYEKEPLSATLDLGYLKQLGKGNWLGGSAEIVLDAEDTRLGIRARYQHRFNDVFTLDISPGIMLLRISDTLYSDDPIKDYSGLDLFAQLNIKKFFGIRFHVDHYRYKKFAGIIPLFDPEPRPTPIYNRGSRTEFHLGFVTRSYIGGMTIAASALVVLIVNLIKPPPIIY